MAGFKVLKNVEDWSALTEYEEMRNDIRFAKVAKKQVLKGSTYSINCSDFPQKVARREKMCSWG